MINLSVVQDENIQVLKVELDEICEPSDLKGMELPSDLSYKKGVIIDGKAPIWVHSFLAHLCHPCKFVGHNDPRVGWIVTQSHCKEVKEGDILN